MTSRSAKKRLDIVDSPHRPNGRATTPKPKRKEAKLQLLRVAVQWVAVYTEGDDPPEEIGSQVINVPAREWPDIKNRVNQDLNNILADITEAGGFDQFRMKVQAEQARQSG